MLRRDCYSFRIVGGTPVERTKKKKSIALSFWLSKMCIDDSVGTFVGVETKKFEGAELLVVKEVY